MNKRTTISLVILTVFSLLLVPRVYAAKKANQASQATSTASKTAGGDQDNKFRLKPDARFKLCLTCHADFQDKLKKPFVHTPLKTAGCVACHNPHASDNVLLVTQSSTIELCGKCHDWQKHQTHPVGDKIIDKRNKNLSVQCLSCHRSHGTEYLHLIPFKTTSDLCVQCHVEKGR